MDAWTRLADLTSQSKPSLAKEFAREVLQRDTVESVSATPETLTVETQHFTGTHAIRQLNGQLVVSGRGYYEVKPDAGIGSLSFKTATVPDCVVKPAQDALHRLPQADQTPRAAFSD